MKTDDEVRQIMDKACHESAAKYLREFAEEIVEMRQRIAELEEQVSLLHRNRRP